MNKFVLFVIICSVLLTNACTEEENLGEIEAPFPVYTLPQGKSPADNRIVELYEKYGSYFLYEFSRRDFIWTYVANSTIPPYQGTPADPAYVGPFLDFLDDVWFKFYPDDFLKKHLPYKVFLVDTLKQVLTTSTTYRYTRIAANQLALSYCSDTIVKMSKETKLAYKIWLQRQLWGDSYVDALEFPEAFYAGTVYTRVTNTTISSPDYFMARGFFQNISSLTSMTRRWDTYYFFWNVMSGTYESISANLEAYPLLKQKYNIMRDHLIQHYGVDIREITDAVYN